MWEVDAHAGVRRGYRSRCNNNSAHYRRLQILGCIRQFAAFHNGGVHIRKHSIAYDCIPGGGLRCFKDCSLDIVHSDLLQQF